MFLVQFQVPLPRGAMRLLRTKTTLSPMLNCEWGSRYQKGVFDEVTSKLQAENDRTEYDALDGLMAVIDAAAKAHGGKEGF